MSEIKTLPRAVQELIKAAFESGWHEGWDAAEDIADIDDIDEDDVGPHTFDAAFARFTDRCDSLRVRIADVLASQGPAPATCISQPQQIALLQAALGGDHQ